MSNKDKPGRGRPAKGAKIKDTGDHDIVQCNHKLHGKYIHLKHANARAGKETVKIFDNDGARILIVPNQNPIDIPGILTESEFTRLKNQAHIVTHQDKMAMMEDAENKKNQLLRESEERKMLLQKKQIKQSVNVGSKLSEAESEAKKRNFYLLQRSFELLQEQDDRVKEGNRIILATKCRAIRNAQIAEKKLIEQQLQEEERRLDSMMEQRRQQLIKNEEMKLQEEERKRNKYIEGIQQQIKENEIERLMEAERLEEESRMLNRTIISLQKEEEEKMKKKREEQARIYGEMQRVNDDNERIKQLIKQEEQLADLRIKEFMRKKIEMEEKSKAEMESVKAKKNVELAKLWNEQLKVQNNQQMIDDMNAQKVQDEMERNWRIQELAAAKKKKELDDELKKAREKQIMELRQAQAIRLARDEQDFHKVAREQQKLYQKDMEKKNVQKLDNIKHRRELLKQINEREREKIDEQKQKFEENEGQRREEQLKSRHVDEYLKSKVEKLKSTGIPDNYIADIDRQLIMRGWKLQ